MMVVLCLGQLTRIELMEEFHNSLGIMRTCLVIAWRGNEPTGHGCCHSEADPEGKRWG